MLCEQHTLLVGFLNITLPDPKLLGKMSNTSWCTDGYGRVALSS